VQLKKFLLARFHVRSVIVVSFFFAENTITAVIYLDVLEAFCFPQLDETENNSNIFQHDGAPPHFSDVLWDALNDTFPA
jgi:hypothetical protein